MAPKKPRAVRGKVKKAKPAAEKAPRAKPVSLWPLTFDEAMKRLIGVGSRSG